MRATQQNPKVITGLAADLPNPVGMPGGTIFFATDTGIIYVLSTSSKTWKITFGGTSKFWSGGVIGQAVGTTQSFLSDNSNTTSLLPGTIALQYPVLFACTAFNLAVLVTANNLLSSTAVAVYKNTVATGIIATIGAGATGLFSDVVDSVTLAPGDTFDLGFININGGGANTLHCAASLQLIPR